MNIIIPSSSIYQKEQNIVRDNSISKIDVIVAKSTKESNVDSPVYSTSVTFQEGLTPDKHKENSQSNRVSIKTKKTGTLEVSYFNTAAFLYHRVNFKKVDIEIEHIQENSKIASVSTKDHFNDFFLPVDITFTTVTKTTSKIKGLVQEGSYSITSTEEQSKDEIQEIPNFIGVSNSYSNFDMTASIESDAFPLPQTGSSYYSISNVEDGVNSKTILSVYFPYETIIEKAQGSVTDKILPLYVDVTGNKEEYFVNRADITVYGKKITIDIKYETETIGEGNKPWKTEQSELLQTTKNYGNTLEEYKNGKETIKIRCSLGEYYGEDGEKAISVLGDNSLPMTFSINDKVIPYVLEADGKEYPISRYPNGDSKIYNVVGVRKFYDGAAWQEITAQETIEVVGGGGNEGGNEGGNTPTIGLKYTLSSNGTYYTCDDIGTATDTDIVIASEIDGIPVTSIGNQYRSSFAFLNRTSITSVTIPDTVTYIVHSAFVGCTSLTSFYVSEDNPAYQSINGTVYSKDGTELVIYPKGKRGAFEIPDEVVKIRDNAFERSTSLTAITFAYGAKCETIGQGAFSACAVLESIVIPDSVTLIRSRAFVNCNALTIYCEAKSQPSGWYPEWNYDNRPVVWDCKNTDVANDGRVYTFIDGLRYGIKDLDAVVAGQPINITVAHIPASVTYKNVVYPVTTISERAFSNCTSLTSIEIPQTVTRIGDNAFYECTSLTIYCEVASKPSGWSNNWNFSNLPVVWGYKNPNPNTITFTIIGTTYQAKQGMTWGEWLESEYNTDSFVARYGYVYFASGGVVALDDDYRTYVRTSDAITDGYAYRYSSG
jgi:hypothetical protein